MWKCAGKIVTLSEIQISDNPFSPVVNLGSYVMTLIQNNIHLSGKTKAGLHQGNFGQLICLEN
jgi:hypothetical protein